MYTISASDVIKFVTNDFIPVKTLGVQTEVNGETGLGSLPVTMVLLNGMLRTMQTMVKFYTLESLTVVQVTLTVLTQMFLSKVMEQVVHVQLL